MIVWKRGPVIPCDGGLGSLPSSVLGINTARDHTLLLRVRFSTVVELTKASWIELPAIPSVKSTNRADRARMRK